MLPVRRARAGARRGGGAHRRRGQRAPAADSARGRARSPSLCSPGPSPRSGVRPRAARAGGRDGRAGDRVLAARGGRRARGDAPARLLRAPVPAAPAPLALLGGIGQALFLFMGFELVTNQVELVRAPGAIASALVRSVRLLTVFYALVALGFSTLAAPDTGGAPGSGRRLADAAARPGRCRREPARRGRDRDPLLARVVHVLQRRAADALPPRLLRSPRRGCCRAVSPAWTRAAWFRPTRSPPCSPRSSR